MISNQAWEHITLCPTQSFICHNQKYLSSASPAIIRQLCMNRRQRTRQHIRQPILSYGGGSRQTHNSLNTTITRQYLIPHVAGTICKPYALRQTNYMLAYIFFHQLSVLWTQLPWTSYKTSAWGPSLPVQSNLWSHGGITLKFDHY